jgi:hypothetical protein
MKTSQLLEMAWSICEVIEDEGDHTLDDLLEGVEEQHGKETRDKIAYLLEVECNVADL